MLASFDVWLTTPPYDYVDSAVGECACCKRELLEGDTAIYNTIDKYTYCDDECCEEEVIKKLDHYLDYFPVNTKRISRFKKFLLRNWGVCNVYLTIRESGDIFEIVMEDDELI